MTTTDWDDLVWPAHERYVAHSLAPLASRITTVTSPKNVGERDAIVSAMVTEIVEPSLL